MEGLRARYTRVGDIGLPVDSLLSAGQTNDMIPVSWLFEGHRFERIVVDKAYDFEAFIAFIKAQDAEAVIPACRCSKPRDFDKQGYKNSKRNLIEKDRDPV